YDYMPGSYNGIPIQVQSGGGVYIIYHAAETIFSNRKIVYCYLDPDGNLFYNGPIEEDYWEGYANCDVDFITGDAFVVWHQIVGSESDVFMTYDLFHLNEGPGIWREPFIVIDNPFDLINPDDVFIWPYIQIGSSPVEGHRRVYVIGINSAFTGYYPRQSVLLAYADFDTEDLTNQVSFEWTYNLIELAPPGSEISFHKSFVVSNDGKVALIGYNSNDEIYVCFNENYGEGEFTLISEDFRFEIDDPFLENREGFFTTFLHCNHFNAIFSANSKINFVGTMGLYYDSGNEIYYYTHYVYPKIFSFDFNLNEFSFFDLYPQDDDPENPYFGDMMGWPIYYYDNEDAYHENYFRIVKNEENNWLAAVWSDGLKAKLANDGEPGYEDWSEVPEIAICISNNNGETWSEPIFLNSLETPELADMIPCYIYPGDFIEDLGNEHGKLHLFFLDDNSYGSYILGNGLFDGGMLKYAALNIDFSYDAAVEENDICSTELVLQTFPNPFHSETTISFNVTQTSRFVTLEIFNIKGQRIRELEIINDKLEMNKVIWDGTDDLGKQVSSGIYFYQLKIDERPVATKKCLLLR
ncbi:MAG TPA: T9SS type A sorting domain-containing protein, partial [Candidatus Cloacimonetes bacterium]|nr:T9SS type A sorting domain-containing protein [Candidatus Cloacimonadota bacterium]